MNVAEKILLLCGWVALVPLWMIFSIWVNDPSTSMFILGSVGLMGLVYFVGYNFVLLLHWIERKYLEDIEKVG